MAARILIVDDEPGVRRSLAIMLRREGYLVGEATDGREAMEQLEAQVFDLVIADLRMEPVSGLDLLRSVKQTASNVEMILMTGFGTVESAVEAMKLGAFDFITKPFQSEEILLRVRNATEKRRLNDEVARLRAEVTSAFGVEGIVAVSESMRNVLRILPKLARTDSTVLITGESGTGKELIARAIHSASRRARGPFISVSSAALPEPLLESELFGHIKGAFTGALAARRGLLEEANGGTFFLDEIGEAPPAIQTKLLRVLEERSVRRLGDNRPIAIDVRFIAATNRELEAAVHDRSFREDLLHRLNVIRLHLPPLRERMDDVPGLVRHFLARHRRQLDRKLEDVSPAALELLMRYPFPGNVREVSNLIEQAVALAAGPLIEPGDLPARVHHPALLVTAPRSVPGVAPPREPIESAEREQLLVALRQANGNISQAAALLGVSRNAMRYRMEKYGLRHPATD